VMPATKAGRPAGGQAEDRRLDASELRNNQGQILVCFIRRHSTRAPSPARGISPVCSW
jgi:hypothetical protein